MNQRRYFLWQPNTFYDTYEVQLVWVSNLIKVEINLHGYSDSDWAGNSIDRKSTIGCCFGLGSAMISSFSRKQSSVTLSSTKAKYIAVTMGARDEMWLRKLLVRLFRKPLKPIVMHYHNQSYTKLLVNLFFSQPIEAH